MSQAARNLVAITPSDTVDQPEGVTNAGLYVKTAGDYKFLMEGGSTVTVNLAAGVLHRLSVKRVFVTGSAGAGANVVGVYEL